MFELVYRLGYAAELFDKQMRKRSNLYEKIISINFVHWTVFFTIEKNVTAINRQGTVTI